MMIHLFWSIPYNTLALGASCNKALLMVYLKRILTVLEMQWNVVHRGSYHMFSNCIDFLCYSANTKSCGSSGSSTTSHYDWFRSSIWGVLISQKLVFFVISVVTGLGHQKFFDFFGVQDFVSSVRGAPLHVYYIPESKPAIWHGLSN